MNLNLISVQVKNEFNVLANTQINFWKAYVTVKSSTYFKCWINPAFNSQSKLKKAHCRVLSFLLFGTLKEKGRRVEIWFQRFNNYISLNCLWARVKWMSLVRNISLEICENFVRVRRRLKYFLKTYSTLKGRYVRHLGSFFK